MRHSARGIIAAAQGASATSAALVANRASGFVSAWHAYDRLTLGWVALSAIVTSADADGETWDSEGEAASDIYPELEIEVSDDAVTWRPALSMTVEDVFTVTDETIVGAKGWTMAATPRHVRCRVFITTGASPDAYAGANDPSVAVNVTAMSA